MTAEEEIYFTQFPEETEFNADDYNDWIADDPHRVIDILMGIVYKLKKGQ